jgi:excisionase family DNA binding protein
MPGLDDLRTLTVEEVAEILGVRPEAVRIWARDGKIEAMRWGRRLRFRPEAVRAFQDAAAVEVANPREFLRKARHAHART